MKKTEIISIILSAVAVVIAVCSLILNRPVAAPEAEPESGDNGDVQYVLYLGTNDKDTNEPVFDKDEAKEHLKAVLIQNFGGYTIQEADGGWIGDDGTIYQEYTLVVYLSDTDIDSVHKVSDQLLTEFNQNSVLIQSDSTGTEFYSGE